MACALTQEAEQKVAHGWWKLIRTELELQEVSQGRRRGIKVMARAEAPPGRSNVSELACGVVPVLNLGSKGYIKLEGPETVKAKAFSPAQSSESLLEGPLPFKELWE